MKQCEQNSTITENLIIDGKYQVIKKIDCNCDVDLYIAIALRLNKTVIVKLLERKKCLFYSELKSAMQKEADIFRECKNDAITQCYEIIEASDYIAEILEYIPGERVFQYIQNNGAVSEDTALCFVNEMIESLRYMRDAGLPYAHGFIGPNSFIVKPEGNISLISTGIIERADRLAATKKIFEDGDLVDYASNRFEAPETRLTLYYTQMESFEKFINEKSDVYSIGALIYYMLTGIDLHSELCEFVPIRNINPSISSVLEHISMQCMNEDPEKRYKTLRKLYDTLNPLWRWMPPPSNNIFKNVIRSLKVKKMRKSTSDLVAAFQNEFSEAEKLHFDDSREFNQVFGPITLPSGKVLTDKDQIYTFQKWKEHNPYFGKQFSILGDSISTLDGYNPDGYNLFYTGDACKKTGVYEMEDTWWGKVIDYFGGKLLVNNSWSGSRVTMLPDCNRLFPSGCSNERTGGLHINNTKPDVILVYLGTNDWAYGVMAGQTLKVNTKKTLLERKKAQQDESVFSFAYNKMLISLRKNYPQVEIFCCTLCETKIGDQPSFQFPNSYGGTHIDVFNRIIRETAAQNGCKCLDLGYYHIPYDSVDGTHPTATGMNTLATLIIREICSLRIENDYFIDCASDKHEFFTLKEDTGAAEYVCRKCGLLRGVMTPYPGASPFEIKYAGSSLNGKLIERPKSGGWSGIGAGPTAENSIANKSIPKMLFIKKHHYPNAIDFGPEGTIILFFEEDGIRLLNEKTNQERTLCKARITIGTDVDNDLKLASVSVSCSHAVIFFDVDRWLIRDNDSENGTWLNDIRLQPEKEYVLHLDDVIDFSKEERFIFCKTAYEREDMGKSDETVPFYLEDGASDSTSVNVGQDMIGEKVDGKYELTDRIGRGGYFSVYRAKDPDGKEVAVKVCDKHGKGFQAYTLEAILQETKAMKTFDHPAIPKLIDTVENDHYIFMVREYISGHSLEEIVKENGAFDEKIAATIAIHLAEVLQYMHSFEPLYLYLDMKPANVILTAEKQVKLIDFGTMMRADSANKILMQAIGTRGYAAPEQYNRASKVDIRTDIYGVGTTLYFLTTGASPNEFVHIGSEVKDADTIHFKALKDIIQKCMEQDPSKRYQTCRELIADLKIFMEDYEKRLCIQNDPINKLQAVMPAVFHFSIPRGNGVILTRIRQQTEKGAVCIAKVVDDYLETEQRETKIIYAGGELVFQAAYDGPMVNRRFEFINELKEAVARILIIPGDNEAYIEYDGRRVFLKWEFMKPPVIRFDPDIEWGEDCDEMRPTIVYQMTEDRDLYHYEAVINGHLPEPLVMILLSLILTAGWG